MPTLRVIWARHGEALPHASAGDIARPLSQRGHEQAQRLACLLEERGWLPDRCLCSPAQRTRETWANLEQTWSQPPPVDFVSNFYLGNLHNVCHAVEELDLRASTTLLLLGHNPGWSGAAQLLSGTSVSLGTADAALLSTEADDWLTALQTTYTWTLHGVLRP